jgi:hypothetical protein
MKKKLKHYFIRLVLLTLVLAIIAVILYGVLPENALPPLLPYMFVLFFVVTAAVHLILLRITRVDMRKFVSYFMMATLIKLVIYFTAVLAYILIHRAGMLTFVISFFTLYIIYTIFEVTTILSQIKDQKVKN